MLRQLVVILAIAVFAAGRRAPNADYVAEFLKSQPQTGYSSNIEQDLLLDAPGLIKTNGYPQETHDVITSDGYVLAAHRIPYGRDRYNSPGDRPVVFLMHGLLSSSADFLVLGPSHALAYTLAEAGYDVWLGNARGNFYSRRHRRYNPDSRIQTFWEFSWDEIGHHDLPAFVDYILKITGQKKLHYIGHSQGGTSFLVLNSLRPEYSEKFISFQGLAPASFFTHNNVSLFNSLANYENILESTAFALGKGEVFANRDFLDWFRSNYCDGRVIFDRICNLSIGDLGSREYYNETLVPLFLAHVPAGASIRQVAHFGQVIRFNAFRRYNFNSLRNLAVYGSLNPPKYNLANVNVPSYIHYGLSDNEVNHKDIRLLGDALPDSRLFQVARPTFNHFDFIWASDVKELLYNKVLNCMKDAERKQ